MYKAQAVVGDAQIYFHKRVIPVPASKGLQLQVP